MDKVELMENYIIYEGAQAIYRERYASNIRVQNISVNDWGIRAEAVTLPMKGQDELQRSWGFGGQWKYFRSDFMLWNFCCTGMSWSVHFDVNYILMAKQIYAGISKDVSAEERKIILTRKLNMHSFREFQKKLESSKK